MLKRFVTARLAASVVSLVLLAPTLANASEDTRRESARAAFAEVVHSSPHARAVWRSGQAGPSVVTGLDLPAAGVSAEERARAFVRDHADLVGVPADALTVSEVREHGAAIAVRMQQQHDDRAVFGREVVVSMDKSGKVIAFTSSALAIDSVRSARLNKDDARRVAQTALAGLVVTDKATAGVVVGVDGAAPALSFLASKPEALRAFRVVVDLSAGTVVGVQEVTQR